MSTRLIKMAALYLLIGICIGIAMGLSQDFSFVGMHAHANLVGWASMGIMALVYKAWPELEASRLATAHFWLHNAGLPLMIGGLYGIGAGLGFGEPMTGVGSILVAVAVACFALNLALNLGRREADKKSLRPSAA